MRLVWQLLQLSWAETASAVTASPVVMTQIAAAVVAALWMIAVHSTRRDEAAQFFATAGLLFFLSAMAYALALLRGAALGDRQRTLDLLYLCVGLPCAPVYLARAVIA